MEPVFSSIEKFQLSPWGAGDGEVETAGTDSRRASRGAAAGQYRPAQCSGADAARNRAPPPGRAELPRDGNEVDGSRRAESETAAAWTTGLPLWQQRWRRRRPEVPPPPAPWRRCPAWPGAFAWVASHCDEAPGCWLGFFRWVGFRVERVGVFAA
jgi:hypothetical protein